MFCCYIIVHSLLCLEHVFNGIHTIHNRAVMYDRSAGYQQFFCKLVIFSLWARGIANVFVFRYEDLADCYGNGLSVIHARPTEDCHVNILCARKQKVMNTRSLTDILQTGTTLLWIVPFYADRCSIHNPI
jgi:hypothetical protein